MLYFVHTLSIHTCILHTTCYILKLLPGLSAICNTIKRRGFACVSIVRIAENNELFREMCDTFQVKGLFT